MRYRRTALLAGNFLPFIGAEGFCGADTRETPITLLPSGWYFAKPLDDPKTVGGVTFLTVGGNSSIVAGAGERDDGMTGDAGVNVKG